jgi:hypothetical protein
MTEYCRKECPQLTKLMTAKADFVILWLVASWLAGCGHRDAPLPPTFPVHGRVCYADGSPVVNGLVQFQPEADRSVTTTGIIAGDGSYALTTVRNGLRAKGAVAGPNRVIVLVASSSDMTREGPAVPNAFPTMYPTPYTVEPRENTFALVVP